MPSRKPALAAHPDLLVDLVAANRILAMEGVLDGYGHVSVRSDKKPEHFFMSRSVGPQLVKDYHIHTEQLTNCSICHR